MERRPSPKDESRASSFAHLYSFSECNTGPPAVGAASVRVSILRTLLARVWPASVTMPPVVVAENLTAVVVKPTHESARPRLLKHLGPIGPTPVSESQDENPGERNIVLVLNCIALGSNQ